MVASGTVPEHATRLPGFWGGLRFRDQGSQDLVSPESGVEGCALAAKAHVGRLDLETEGLLR